VNRVERTEKETDFHVWSAWWFLDLTTFVKLSNLGYA
jgi:hypothetical protein